MVPLLAVVLALLLALTAQIALWVLTIAAVALLSTLAMGIRGRTRVPMVEQSTWLGIIGGSAAAGLILSAPVARAEPSTLTPLLLVLGVGLIAAVAMQLARSDGRDNLVGSLSYAVGLLLLTSLTASWVAVGGFEEGPAVLWLCAAAAAAALAVQAVPLPRLVTQIAGLVVAALVGLWIVLVVSEVNAVLTEPTAVLVALLVAAAALAGLVVGERLLGEDSDENAVVGGDPPGRLQVLAAAILPLTFAGPIAYTSVWALAS